MRVHVLGAGAIGCLFAHHFSAAGWPVTLLLRAEALREFERAGRVVRCGGAAAHCTAEAVGAGPPGAGAGAAPIENLLVTTKVGRPAATRRPAGARARGGGGAEGAGRSPPRRRSRRRRPTPPPRRRPQAGQTAAAVAAVAHRLSPASVVLLLQNGVLAVHDSLVGPPGAFASAAARPQFLLGSTTHGATRRGPFDVVWHEGAAVFGRPLDGGGSSGGGSSGGGGGSGGEGSGASSSSGGSGSSSSGGEATQTGAARGAPQSPAATGAAAPRGADRAAEVLAALRAPELAPLRIDASLTPEQLHGQVGPGRGRLGGAAAAVARGAAEAGEPAGRRRADTSRPLAPHLLPPPRSCWPSWW
jgi:hypothetical protein